MGNFDKEIESMEIAIVTLKEKDKQMEKDSILDIGLNRQLYDLLTGLDWKQLGRGEFYCNLTKSLTIYIGYDCEGIDNPVALQVKNGEDHWAIGGDNDSIYAMIHRTIYYKVAAAASGLVYIEEEKQQNRLIKLLTGQDNG